MKKMDEMELSLAFKAVRIVYLYSIIFEFIYWTGQCIVSREIKFSGMFLLLTSQNIVLYLARYYYKMKVDDPEGKQGIKFFFLSLLIIGLAGFAIYIVSN